MNEVLQALILGIVQGLTELLPVSSSAHLNLFPWVFGWGEISASFDVALHIGTLFAIVIFFFKDWLNLIKGGYNQVVKKEKSTEGKIFWYIVISTIPTALLCVILDKISGIVIEKLAGSFNVEEKMIEMFLIAFALIIMGIVLYVVDKKSKSKSKSISSSPSDEGECVPRARRFTPPTYEEVLSYACDRGFPDLAQRFFDYFTAGDWIDSKGNKVKNWKQKFLTWESAEKERRTSRGNGETAGERPASDWGLDAIVI